MKPTYIIFGKGVFFVSYSCLSLESYLVKKRAYKLEGFGFVEYKDRRIETLKRLGLKEY